MSAQFPPSVPLATLYERESAKGTRYMLGRLGLAKIVLLPGEPTEDGTPTWRLLIQEAPPKDDAAQQRPGDAAPRSSAGPARQRRPYPGRERAAATADPRPFDDEIGDLYARGEP